MKAADYDKSAPHSVSGKINGAAIYPANPEGKGRKNIGEMNNAAGSRPTNSGVTP